MALPSFFQPSALATKYEIYGFGILQVGETAVVNLDDTEETPIKIRSHISGHGQYYGKKFRTKVVGSLMHILRTA